MTIGDKLKKERMRLGLSQTELGRLTKIKPQQLSRWEHNKVVPGLESIRSICSALAIDEREITGEWPSNIVKYQVEPVITGDSLDDRLAREIWSAYSPEQKRIAVRLLHDVATRTQTVDHNS